MWVRIGAWVLSVGAGLASPQESRHAWLGAVAARYERQPVRELRLNNGLRTLVLARGDVPWCALAAVFPGGAHDDPPGKSGLAHLAEHMLFEAGPHGNTDAEAEALGIRSNAFTLGDYTVVVDEFSPAVLAEAVVLHARRLQPRSIDDAQLIREKQVVADERRYRVEEPPLGRAEERLEALLWGPQGEGRPVLGWPAEVMRLSRDDVTAWMAEHVRPERGVVALVGAVQPDVAQNLLLRALGNWAVPPASRMPASAAPPVILAGTRLVGPMDTLMMAMPASPLGGADEMVDHVLARLLSGEPTHRLRVMPQDWPGVEVQAELRPEKHKGQFLMTVLGHGAATPPELESAVGGLMQSLVLHGPTPEAVRAAVQQVGAGFNRELDGHAPLAERLAVDAALLGDWRAEGRRLRALSGVTPEAVQSRARALWAQPQRAVIPVWAEHP